MDKNNKIFNNANTKKYRSDLRHNMTKSETILWKHLKGDQLNIRFRRQYGIGKFIVDFYCPKYKLAVEIDGITHCEEKIFERDLQKEKFLKQLGITLRRYNSKAIFYNLKNVIEDIYQTCELLKRGETPPTPS